MAFKIYIEGNTLLIDDLSFTPPLQYEGIAKECLLTRKYNDSTDFSFKGVNNWNTSTSIDFTDLDLTGADYTDLPTFLTWCRENLGKSSPQGSGNQKDVYSLNDIPTSIGDVITLEANTAYKFKNNIDFQGKRMVGSENTALLGSTSETSFLTSTGLTVGVPFFTTSYTTPVQNLSFIDIDTAIEVNGTSTTALDWDKFNIINCPNIGVINGCSNWILTNSAFLNSKGLEFDGDLGTIGVANSLFVGDGLLGNVLKVRATANVTRRFRLIYSSFVVIGSNTGVNFDVSATVPTEAYILETINFSGDGVYLSGVLSESNKSLYKNCVGISNTSINGQLYMRDNATVTTISNSVDFYKVLGTTIPSIDNSKYSHANNRLTCEAVIERKYLITCSLSFNTGNNRVCEFGFFDSKLNDIRQPSITKSTSNSGGRQEGVTFSCVVNHSQGDYLEIHCRNTTDFNNITVTDMNFIITEIN